MNKTFIINGDWIMNLKEADMTYFKKPYNCVTDRETVEHYIKPQQVQLVT
jgi:hypothetical protein